jgi:hypothetical protein
MSSDIFDGSAKHVALLNGTDTTSKLAVALGSELQDYRNASRAMQWIRALPVIQGDAYDVLHPQRLAAETLLREVDRSAGALNRALAWYNDRKPKGDRDESTSASH